MSYRSGQQLGALPVGAALTVLGPIGSLIGGSDPTKDAQRKARIDATFAAAMAGDPDAISCLQDMAQGVSSGPNDPRQCAVGSKVAADYAVVKWNELKARQAAGQVGITLIGQSDIPTRTAATAIGVATNPWVLGGLALGAFLLLRRRRR